MTAPNGKPLSASSPLTIGLGVTITAAILTGVTKVWTMEGKIDSGQARIEALGELMSKDVQHVNTNLEQLTATVQGLRSSIDGRYEALAMRVGQVEASIASLKAQVDELRRK